MKKLIILAILLTNFVSNSQCSAPTNINLINNIAFLNTVELSWTENGTVKDYTDSLNRMKFMRDIEGAQIFMAHDQDQYAAKGARWYK